MENPQILLKEFGKFSEEFFFKHETKKFTNSYYVEKSHFTFFDDFSWTRYNKGNFSSFSLRFSYFFFLFNNAQNHFLFEAFESTLCNVEAFANFIKLFSAFLCQFFSHLSSFFCSVFSFKISKYQIFVS